MTDWARQDALKAVYAGIEVDPAFDSLRKPGINLVPGRGSMHPRCIFIGEAPGEAENKHRKPFVGPAGRVFQLLLDHVGIKRADVFVTNVVKYRPVTGIRVERNRAPWPSELKASRSHLRGELGVFGGAPVVTMGVTGFRAVSGLLNGSLGGGAAGHAYDIGLTPFFALYHPAYAMYDTEVMDRLPMMKEHMERMAAWLTT